MADKTTYAKIAGFSVLLVAVATGAVYQQGHPSYVLQGDIVLQLPNDGGVATGTISGVMSALTLTTLDGGTGSSGTPDSGVIDTKLDASSTTSSFDAGVVSVPPVVIPPSTGTTLASAVVTGSGPQSFGIPFALGKVTPTTSLALYQGSTKIPSAVSALATWPDGSIKWGLFSASVSPGQIDVKQEATAQIPSLVTAVLTGGTGDSRTITVSTGSHQFVIDNSSLLASVIQTSGMKTLATGTPIKFDVGGATHTLGKLNEVSIYRNDGESAVVVFESDLVNSAAPTSATNLGLRRVYRFWSDSGLVDVRFVILNYVNKCGDGTITCNGAPNGTLVNSGTTGLSSVIAQVYLQAGGLNSSGVSGSLEQIQRDTTTTPYAFNLTTSNATGTASQSGSLATNALLEATTNTGSYIRIGVPTLAYMEPQILRADASGVNFDFISKHIWVGGKQGMATEFTVEFGSTSNKGLTRPTVVPLGIAATGVLESSPLSATEAKSVFEPLLTKTLALRETKGLYGFNVYGGQPRYWGDYNQTEEIAMSSWSGSTWDKFYSGSLMTDYHNSAEAATAYAMSTNNVDVLTRISRPAALRQLYTQMEQCAVGDTNFYCFQIPRGYSAFMSDFNSSHAYVGNLFLHYFLTGDMDVTRALYKGATSMRNYVCSSRPGSACGVDVKPSDQWASLTGRVFSQWQRIYRFLGQTVDKSFTADWLANEERSLKQTTFTAKGPNGEPVVGWISDYQIWMNAIYDMRNLIALQADYQAGGRTADAVRVQNFIVTLAKTLVKYATADGKPSSRWPNSLFFYSTGTTLAVASDTVVASILPNTTASDSYLYDSGKVDLVRLFCSAATSSNDASLVAVCNDFKQFGVNYLKNCGLPMSKTVGIATSGLSGVF